MNMYKVTFTILNQNNTKKTMDVNVGYEKDDIPSDTDIEFFLKRDYLDPHEVIYKRLQIDKVEFLEET